MSWVITPSNALVDDQDALTYLAAVEAADGQALESATRLAVNAFVKGCKADGIWPAIKASCILAGARTLAGALVPLVGTAPTNVGGLFVSGDYNRETGLVGDGSTKYLNSNRNNNADPQNSKHISLYGSFSVASGTERTVMGITFAASGWTAFNLDNRATSGFQPWINGANYPSGMVPLSQSGFFGATRSGSTTIDSRIGSSSYSRSVNSNSPASGLITVFGAGTAGSNGRIAFYSIGESLNLALLDTRVTTLINAFAAAIP
tara:strand:- start:591 stop:1376 length:786 start_codon:yes stop_codon:yes gene_type:complete